MTLVDSLLFSDQCLDQPSSEKLHPAADGKKYRDPQQANIERGGLCNSHIPEENASINHSWDPRELCER